jgi:hypothetical protein
VTDTRNITSNPDSIPDIKQAFFDKLVPGMYSYSEHDGNHSLLDL